MIKEESNQFDPTKKWIQDAGTSELCVEFHLYVLKKIQAMVKTSLTYKSAISTLAWSLIRNSTVES